MGRARDRVLVTDCAFSLLRSRCPARCSRARVRLRSGAFRSWAPGRRSCTFAAPWTGGGRSCGQLRWHGAERSPAAVERDGVLVTSAVQTVVDLARTTSFASAVVAADHALRYGLVSREELGDEIRALGTVRGVRRASAVAAFADGRSESVGESLSRARIRELGLVVPELQVEVSDRSGLIRPRRLLVA